MINLQDLTKKTVVVTGGSSGIGKETAILLSKLGARIVLIARDEVKLMDTIKLLDGDNHGYISFDLLDFDNYKEMVSSICSKYGRISGFVHCAGVSKLLPLRNIKHKDIQELMEINYHSFMMSAHHITKKKYFDDTGSIVAVSSIAGDLSNKGLSIYSGSKGAINSSIRGLAQELASRNIRINAVAPGYLKTELTDKSSQAYTTEARDAIYDEYPLGEGSTIDVANLIGFLISDSSRWITGQTITIDGGFSLK